MTEVPKIVVDRLRAAVPAHPGTEPAHPDADLLTAFAEQSLLPEERDGVLEHLVLCQDCREVVSLALPLAEPAASAGAVEVEPVLAMPSVAKAERNWLGAFGWPTLRWAALAAGVIVGGSLLLSRHGNTPSPVPPNQQAAISAPAASAPQVAPSMDHVATFTRDDVAKPRAESLSKKSKADQPARGPVPAESGILIADAKIADAKKDTARADKLSPAGPPALDSPAPRSMNETVEVSGAAADVYPAPSTAGNFMARNQAPAVEKAKPAPPEIGAQPETMQESGTKEQMKTSAARASGSARSAALSDTYSLKKEAPARDAVAPNFKLKVAAGLLQRSVDDGLTWQIGLRSDHPLLCYSTLGLDVWAGGQAGTLFHSTDGGVTWVPVQPAAKGQSLSTDVVSIQVRGPQVLVSTRNNETWSTADDGQTWDKK